MGSRWRTLTVRVNKAVRTGRKGKERRRRVEVGQERFYCILLCI